MNTEINKQPESMPFGNLAPWEQDDLPEPPAYTLRNLIRTIGPGAILLATSIGGGEWLIGPAITVKYGTDILWIAFVAIALQLAFNLEAIRYTLYTGEPALIGFMRLRPGSKFWAAGYIFITIAQLGVPALAAGCASVLFATFAGRLAGDGDTAALQYLTYIIIIVTFGILLSGKTIERLLEYLSWFMVTFIFLFLLVVNLLFVPFSHWMKTFSGFFQFGSIPADVDLLLLITFAATAGSGGIGNLVITNWYRDKGFGMGAKVGSITSAFSKREIHLSPVGKVFPVNEKNMKSWKMWWKYVSVDQVWLWGTGCVVGMFLNVNITTAIIPSDTEMDHMAAAPSRPNSWPSSFGVVSGFSHSSTGSGF
ncbi:MAG: Nramp family divalent metal transporter [Planctomycetaceae bacterium]